MPEPVSKSIHDPLYGFIDLTGTEIRVIDTAIFRRLHRIRQISQAYAVYPSAHHTRFEHSLGVCHLAGRVAGRLGFDAERTRVVRMAGLLHDIGHGPFSHLFEPIMEKANGRPVSHESISRMILRQDPEISGILGEMAAKVECVLARRPVPGWSLQESALAADVISGPLDVDRMDYLRRDSYHLGVSYGRFDMDQLIHTIMATGGSGEGRVCIDIKGWGAAEEYRLSRYLMHAQVYQHHTIIIANRMCQVALEEAMDEGALDPGELRVGSPGFVEAYGRMDDQSLHDAVRRSGGTGAGIMERVRRRDLLKRIFEVYPDREIQDPGARLRMARMDGGEQDRMASEMARDLGLPRHEIIVHSSHIPVNHGESQILVMLRGIPHELDESSPIMSGQSSINRFYVFGPDGERVRRGVAGYMEAEFGPEMAGTAGP